MSDEELFIQHHVKLEEGQVFKSLGSKSSQRKGQDTDYELYAVLDANGEEVKRYLLTNSMSMYPPFTRHIDVKPVDQDYALPTR